MNWKCWMVIAASWLVIIAVLLVSRSCQNEWAAKDASRVEDIQRYQFLAQSAGQKAAIAAEDANTSKRKAAALEEEIEKLKTLLQPVTYEPCRVPVARRDRIIRKQEEQIDILEATEQALWLTREHDLEEIKNLRIALELQGDRADGWKKSASKSRRDKILIGVGSAIGGAGVMALAVYGAGQL
jgi:hypothetical protein